MIPKCEIRWIDCRGNATPDTNDAIGYAVNSDLGVRVPICTEHARYLERGKCHYDPNCSHPTKHPTSWRVEPFPKKPLVERYRFFREHAGYAGYIVVGESARSALALARAEAKAEARGLKCVWEYETDSYESVHGEPLPDDVDGPYWVWVPHPEKEAYPMAKRWPIASIGMVLLSCRAARVDSYRRVVEAELFVEALDVLDGEDEEEAAKLAARATYAMEISHA